MPIRAALYARQSLDRDGTGLAVARQLEDCHRIAELRGWQVSETFVDNDVSASNGKARPAYDRLTAAIRAGRVDAVVTWSADRLSRRPIEIESLIDLVDKYGTRLAMVSGEVDLGTPYGQAVARIFAAIARQEVAQKGARQARANRQRAENGKVGWTVRPFGYERDSNGRVRVVEAEANALRTAAARALTGATMASICRDLNASGYVTSRGKRWTVTTLKRLLLNPRLAGAAMYRGEPVAEGDWPAIFDAPTHDRLRVLLSDPSRRTANHTASKYLLSGLARCGRCGEVMFASPMGSKSRRWMVYRCRTPHLARRLDLVDEVVENVVIARLQLPDAAVVLSDEVDVVALRAEADELRRRRDDLAGALADGLLTAAAVRAAAGKLRTRLQEIDTTIAAAAGDMSALAMLVTAEDVTAAWEALTLQEKRDVVDLLVTVTIRPAVHRGARFDVDDVDVEWNAGATA